MIMNCLILNRDYRLPEDGWHQVAPAGEHAHPPSGLVQVIDTTALESMVRMFRQEAQQAQFPGLLVDYDHFSEDTAKPSEAAGWITELEGRADGLWARIRWSDSGEKSVKGGEYRLASPVFAPGDVEKLANKTVRPLRLDSLAVTNDPQMRGAVPLSNRENKGQTMDYKAMLLKLLGLGADATDQAIQQGCDEGGALENKCKALKNRVAELETQNATMLETQAEADLAKYGSRFKPEIGRAHV